MSDALHEDLRHTIRLCWKSLRGQEVFKAIEVNQELAAMCPEEFSAHGQITATMACGSSANRLCEILAGKELKDYSTNPDAIDPSNSDSISKCMLAMKQNEGYVLVRINVVGGGAGHSYIFLSNQHHAGEALKGYIYQTNVGCHKDSAFDLITWIDDKKSETEVDFATHLSEIVKGFKLAAGFTYQEKYMLSDKALKQDELADLKAKSAGAGAAKFLLMWSPVVLKTAQENLLAIRQRVPAEKAPAKKFATA
ncbi:MAG TPA: hypothetical protein VFB43_01660 [Terracidiphilus sp.]|nr:hypothetical protein [Terracidiphilus sp.]